MITRVEEVDLRERVCRDLYVYMGRRKSCGVGEVRREEWMGAGCHQSFYSQKSSSLSIQNGPR